MSTLRKLDDGRYEVRGRLDSKQVRKRLSRKKDAEALCRRLDVGAERRRAGLPAERGEVTYGELVDAFLDQYDRMSKNWKCEMLAYSVAAFGNVLVRRLDSAEIGSWLHRLPYESKTKQHILDAMRQVLSQGVEWGYVARNPARAKAVQAPRASTPDIRPFQSWDEVNGVATATDRYANLVLFGCATSLRPEEWIPLRWDDIDLSRRTCRINKVCVDGAVRTDQGKTDAAFRVVHLQRVALQALAAQAKSSSGGLIFPAPEGDLINLDNWRRRFWKEAFSELDIAYRPLLQMRHTFATLALSAGADIYFVMKELGHTNIRTTLKHYARFQPNVDERNLGLLDGFSQAEITTETASGTNGRVS